MLQNVHGSYRKVCLHLQKPSKRLNGSDFLLIQLLLLLKQLFCGILGSGWQLKQERLPSSILMRPLQKSVP